MQGLLLIDKPQSWTSFDAVAYVRAIVARAEGKRSRSVKVGHIGTLDPMATGLLVLCVGKEYTRRVPTMIKHDKTYEAQVTLGSTSDTGDAEGVITESVVGDVPDRERVETALRGFCGEIEQTPPAYSAIKVNGKRAYELARAGKPVVMQPRRVMVHAIDCLQYEWPVIEMTCHVGSGTYIRSLAEDIGSELGVGAHLSGLRRTKIAQWHVNDASSPKTISVDNIADKLLA